MAALARGKSITGRGCIMATIKQFVVTVNDVTNKDNPFVSETHVIRAKSKAEACDAIWVRLASDILAKDGSITAEEARNLAARHLRMTCDLKRSITAVGYQEKAARDKARAQARAKAAAKDSAGNALRLVR